MYTWKSPDDRTRNQIDFKQDIKKFIKSVKSHPRTKTSSECADLKGLTENKQQKRTENKDIETQWSTIRNELITLQEEKLW